MLNDADLQSLGVPADKSERFRTLLDSAVQGWQRQTDKVHPPRRGDVVRRLDQLIDALKPFQHGGGAGEAAGALWQAAMAGQCHATIDEIIDAAKDARMHATELPNRGAPRGTRTASPGFDNFLFKLFTAASICGFEWTAYKDRETGEVVGTLPSLMCKLEPHLPPGYFPQSAKTRLNAIDKMRRALHPK